MLNQTRRVIRILSGVALLLAGTAMLVLPGPGVLVIAIGLGLLAEDFPWARSALDRLKRGAKAAVNAVRNRKRST